MSEGLRGWTAAVRERCNTRADLERIFFRLCLPLLAVVITAGCDPFRPYDPASYDAEIWNRPTPHIGAPRPGKDDFRPWPYDGFTAGPFYKSLDTFDGGRLTTVLGPLLRVEKRPDGTRRIQVPLLFSYGEKINPINGFVEKKARLLWPLVYFSERRGEKQLVIYPLLWAKERRFRGVDGCPPRTVFDVKLFPVLNTLVPLGIVTFNYDTRDGPTAAIIPVIGVARHFLGRDKVTFYGPLFIKCEGSGYTSWFYPWPVLGHWRSEDGKRKGFQVWPFYKVDRNDGSWYKRSIMLLWNEYNSQLNTRYPTHSYSFFPFYISRKSARRVQYTVLWPFFHYYERRQPDPKNPDPRILPRKEYTLWPFFHYATGKNVFALSLWPLLRIRQTPRLRYWTIGPGRETFLPVATVLNIFRQTNPFDTYNPAESFAPTTALFYEWEKTKYRDYTQVFHRWLLFAYYRTRSWYEKKEGGEVFRLAKPPAGERVSGRGKTAVSASSPLSEVRAPLVPANQGRTAPLQISPERAEGFASGSFTAAGAGAGDHGAWKPRRDVRSLAWPFWRYDRTADGAWHFRAFDPVFTSDPGGVIHAHYGFLWEMFSFEAPSCGDRRLRALFGTLRADWNKNYIHHGFYPLYDWWSVYKQNDRLLFTLGDGLLYRHYRSPAVLESGNLVFRYRRELHPAGNIAAGNAKKVKTYRLVRRWEILWGLLGVEKDTFVRNGAVRKKTARLRFFWTSLDGR